ncbi:hypothetical protein AB0M20_22835 [Actinoplanes sp. NPDC051633]|uniref:hypothetical protein n=1 Tax=Actinoplanes sp. NPDC051633 TaxID=3155670 RepID=UPI003425FF93
MDGLRLIDRAGMEPGEQRQYDELHASLVAANQNADSPLRFGAGEPITVVCSEVPAGRRAAFGNLDAASGNRINAYKFADLDSLIALLPSVGAHNPASHITVGIPSELTQTDLAAHLVLLGGVDWNPVAAAILSRLDGISIRQLERPTDDDAGGFVVERDGDRRTFTPRLVRDAGSRALMEDVALVLRAPNPYNRQRTLTMFNGSFNHGTLGVVKSMADPEFHRRNAAYVARRFAGVDTYGIVCRVEMVADQVVIPDWTLDATRLHEWPDSKP